MVTKLLSVSILVILVVLILFSNKNASLTSINPTSKPVLATPTPNPFPYKIPSIPSKRAYLTYLVGDSIVGAMGANAEGLRQNLLKLYPGHEFVNYNYGFAATNILSLETRLKEDTIFNGTSYPPILTQGFDLIILESFAYNPLSEYPGDSGLKKYEEVLDANIRSIISSHPDAVIALMTPIAPNKENFARYTYHLTAEKRLQWVNERLTYIEKLKSFANEKQIPLIDVYSKSVDMTGNGILKYIDSHDYIHPSKEGIKLIEKTIADFIFENKIFPE